MVRNGYLGVGRLGTHPAFQTNVAALVCPYTYLAGCTAEPFTRVRDYDRHFLAHQPTAETAIWWMSAHTYDRVAPTRGWPSSDQALQKWDGTSRRTPPRFDPTNPDHAVEQLAELLCALAVEGPTPTTTPHTIWRAQPAHVKENFRTQAAWLREQTRADRINPS